MSIRVGRAIRCLREARAVSLSDVATKSGMSLSFLSLVETGNRNASVDVLTKVARALDVPADVLILIASRDGSSLQTRETVANRLLGIMSRLDTIEQELKDAVGENKSRHVT